MTCSLSYRFMLISQYVFAALLVQSQSGARSVVWGSRPKHDCTTVILRNSGGSVVEWRLANLCILAIQRWISVTSNFGSDFRISDTWKYAPTVACYVLCHPVFILVTPMLVPFAWWHAPTLFPQSLAEDLMSFWNACFTWHYQTALHWRMSIPISGVLFCSCLRMLGNILK